MKWIPSYKFDNLLREDLSEYREEENHWPLKMITKRVGIDYDMDTFLQLGDIKTESERQIAPKIQSQLDLLI